MKKRILFVCLGNICRSPAAEAVFLHHISLIGKKKNYQVDSAGTGGWHVGNHADERMIKAALNRGIHIQSKARRIHPNDFHDFDLILTMDNTNLADVRQLWIESGRNKNVRIEPLLSFSKNKQIAEVPDPYYGGENGFEEVLDLLEDAIQDLIAQY